MNMTMLNDDDRRTVSFASTDMTDETKPLLELISRLTDRLADATQVAADYVEVYVGTTEHSNEIYQKAQRVCAAVVPIAEKPMLVRRCYTDPVVHVYCCLELVCRICRSSICHSYLPEYLTRRGLGHLAAEHRSVSADGDQFEIAADAL